MEEKIKFELVPNGLMGISLKNGLDKGVWDKLRKIALKKCENKCACCGKMLKSFEAHEVWEYNKKTKTRKLVNIIAVCSNCHKAIHMNRTYVCENYEKIEDHYMKVNNASYAEMKQALKLANEKQKELNDIYDWKLDLSFLEEFIK
ncbi:MAG: hypothetical protein KBS91_01625 [Firmicutes bacterium]|nr:hypothetical protein [Candidatus Caballimonas caccae]